MGVFSASISESFSGGYVPELETNDYNAGALASDNFAEMAILGSIETTAIHKSLVESLAGQEIAAMEEGYEVVYEASSIESIGNKIRSLIQKAIEKLKSLFEKVIAVFRSWTSSDKTFIKKYQSTFTLNFNKLKKLDMNVFEYNNHVRATFTGNADAGATTATNIIDGIRELPIDTSTNDAVKFSSILGTTGAFDSTSTNKSTGAKTNSTATSDDSTLLVELEKIKAAVDKQDSTANSERLRGVCFAIIKDIGGDGAGSISNAAKATDELKKDPSETFSAKEFSDRLYEWYRKDNDSKDHMDLSDLKSKGYAPETIISILSNGEKATHNLEKYFVKLTHGFNKAISNVNKLVSKEKYDSSDADENKFRTLKTWVIVQYSSTLSTALECIQTWKGQYLQACKEYSRTCKNIATKVVAMGEKRLAQEESWDYGYDNDYSDSFMNAVVIK